MLHPQARQMGRTMANQWTSMQSTLMHPALILEHVITMEEKDTLLESVCHYNTSGNREQAEEKDKVKKNGKEVNKKENRVKNKIQDGKAKASKCKEEL